MVKITPEICDAIMQFMSRVQLQGLEAPSFMACIEALTLVKQDLMVTNKPPTLEDLLKHQPEKMPQTNGEWKPEHAQVSA